MNVPAGEVAITTTIPADLLKRVDERAKQELISRAAGLAYPIRDGIPIMLPEEARKLGTVSE